MGVSKRRVLLIVCGLTLMMLGYQNCSSEIQFSSDQPNKVAPGNANSNGGDNGIDDQLNTPPADGIGPVTDDPGLPPPGTDLPPREIICDPLAPTSELCEQTPPPPPVDGETPPGGTLPPPPNSGPFPGLAGDLYFLSHSAHGDLFNDNLNQAVLDDYLELGIKAPFAVVMTQINVTPRSWQESFVSNQGNVVVDDQGNPLLEYFSLRLSGQIKLPAGSYQFAMVSDDGMRVVIDNVPILDHDGVHAPTLDCAAVAVGFNGTDSKNISVAYFQGPRVEIAMQLLMRPLAEDDGSCRGDGSWQEVPASAFSH